MVNIYSGGFQKVNDIVEHDPKMRPLLDAICKKVDYAFHIFSSLHAIRNPTYAIIDVNGGTGIRDS